MNQHFSEVMSSITLIGFDLDDTLWDNRPVILAAIDAQNQCLHDALPTLAITDIASRYQSIAESLHQNHPSEFQDVTRLRQVALKQFCTELGLPDAIAQAAFSAFFEARQRITLYPTCEPLIASLAASYRLVAISNGNSSLDNLPIAEHFAIHWRGGLDGPAKPDPGLLLRACETFEVTPSQMLYVGDHLKYDYLAAKNAGTHSLLIGNERPPEDALYFISLEDFYSEYQRFRAGQLD